MQGILIEKITSFDTAINFLEFLSKFHYFSLPFTLC